MPRAASLRTAVKERPAAKPAPARKAAVVPATLPSIITAMNDSKLFKPFFPGESWNGWRTILKAGDGLPMTDTEVEFFKSVSGGRAPPTSRMRELWLIAGRRAGKDSIASMLATFAAATFNSPHLLRPGERGLVACMACDRAQARIVLGYIRAFFQDIPLLANMVVGDMRAEGFGLRNGIDIEVMANSYRAIRGRPILLGIMDEISFWRDENSARPDEAFYQAIAPGLVTLASAGSRLIAISSPYRKSGLLYKNFKDSFGRDDANALVIQAPTRVLNPTVPQEFVDRAIAKDPASAAAEFGAQFRDDVGSWIGRDLIERAAERGTTVRPPHGMWEYKAFCDPSGGRVDSFTAAIAHEDGGMAVMDCLLEVKPPFNPMEACAQVAAMLQSYGLTEVTGDRYSAEWVVGGFAAYGISYVPSERDRSAIYSDALPLFTSGRAVILDNERLISQFSSLERKTSTMGRDRIDHAPGAHDDLANSAAGALVAASAPDKRPKLYFS